MDSNDIWDVLRAIEEGVFDDHLHEIRKSTTEQLRERAKRMRKMIQKGDTVLIEGLSAKDNWDRLNGLEATVQDVRIKYATVKITKRGNNIPTWGISIPIQNIRLA